MSLFLWKSQCRYFGHRPYALAAFTRKSSPTHNSISAESGTEGTVVDLATRKVTSGRLTKNSLRPTENITPRRNLLEQTKVQDYLDFVASTNNTVALADIERCRPPEHGAPGTPKYENDYNSLLDTLVRSFSTKQLRQFLHLYQLGLPRKRTKWHYAMSIIERQWGWPSLSEIQEQHRDWTQVAQASRSSLSD